MKASPIDIKWHPELSIYASELFLKLVGDDYGWIGGIDDSGKLCCVLPYTIIRKAFFRIARFRIETIPIKNGFDIQEEKLFLNSVIDFFRSIDVDMVIPATTNTIFRTYPDGAIVAPYGSFIIDLCQSEETLWTNLHSKHRNVIRNAKKKGVEIKEGIKYLDISYALIRDTLKRSDLKFMGYNAYKNFVLGLKENVKIYVCNYDSAAQGCAVIPFSLYGAYYLYGGSIPKPISGANNLLQWEAIQQFRHMDVKRYDFVGVRINPDNESKQEGLMKFKERFGGQLAKGYMWKYSLAPLKFGIYNLAVRYLKGGDIVDQENHKFINED